MRAVCRACTFHQDLPDKMSIYAKNEEMSMVHAPQIALQNYKVKAKPTLSTCIKVVVHGAVQCFVDNHGHVRTTRYMSKLMATMYATANDSSTRSFGLR